MLDELTHAVQVRRTVGDFDVGWHTIAAFDVLIAAIRYKDNCRRNAEQNRLELEYRVVEREDWR